MKPTLTALLLAIAAASIAAPAHSRSSGDGGSHQGYAHAQPGAFKPCQDAHRGTAACQSAARHQAEQASAKARAAELQRIHQIQSASSARRQKEVRQAQQGAAQAGASQRAWAKAGAAAHEQRSWSGNPYGQWANGRGQRNAARGAPSTFR